MRALESNAKYSLLASDEREHSRLKPLGSAVAHSRGGCLHMRIAPLDDASTPLRRFSRAFGRSRLQNFRPIREHIEFAHPYIFLLRKWPTYGDTE
jgi:hypothetical protein